MIHEMIVCFFFNYDSNKLDGIIRSYRKILTYREKNEQISLIEKSIFS